MMRSRGDPNREIRVRAKMPSPGLPRCAGAADTPHPPTGAMAALVISPATFISSD